MMAVLSEQDIINRNNIVALNEAQKRIDKQYHNMYKKLVANERALAMANAQIQALTGRVNLLTAMVHTGGSTA